MKNLNKLAMGILVGALAIGFSAFTNAKANDNANMADAWFQLKSTVSVTKANALDTNNYGAPTTNPSCTGAASYCGVRANNVSGKPDLTGTSAQTAITDYFDSGIDSALIQERN